MIETKSREMARSLDWKQSTTNEKKEKAYKKLSSIKH